MFYFFYRKSRLAKSNNGFSLVELLVVVAILAVLAAIAIPVFLNQKDKANAANIRSDMHTVIIEMETLRNSLAPGASYTDAGTVAAAVGPALPASKTGINILINCSVNSTLTTATASPGNYIVLGMKPSAPNTWNYPWAGGEWAYDSASSKWFGPFATTPDVFTLGWAGAACGSSTYSGAAYLVATK